MARLPAKQVQGGGTPRSGTMAQLNALGLGASDHGAVALCTDYFEYASNSNIQTLVEFNGVLWQRRGTVALGISALRDDDDGDVPFPFTGTPAAFGASVQNGNLVLMTDSATGSGNGGIWIYNPTNLWTRHPEFPIGTKIYAGATFFVRQTENAAAQIWVCDRESRLGDGYFSVTPLLSGDNVVGNPLTVNIPYPAKRSHVVDVPMQGVFDQSSIRTSMRYANNNNDPNDASDNITVTARGLSGAIRFFVEAPQPVGGYIRVNWGVQ